ncbi:patatin-like phospholipase family protein [Tsukamurella soli]|uniref:Patatin-like phospholipase family protein n=1 Tax=Tsukamurella soli TaxID=644556 RepID=A0ABP8JIG8_9ACTN
MRVALALGSGGARGYAHIGVIDELTARGHEVVGVAGSSMGALVGGLQAAGALREYTDWVRSLNQRAVLRLLDPSVTAAGVLRAEKIIGAVRDIVGDVAVEDLPIPFTSVATDLIAGRSVWLQRGSLSEAIRASIAIPGVIAPHVLDGRLLADGGILEPIPMAPISAVNADLTIAVSLGGDDPEARLAHTESRTADRLGRMWRSTSSLLETKAVRSLLETTSGRAVLGRFVPEGYDYGDVPADPDRHIDPLVADDVPAPSAPRLGGFEVMNRTIDIAQAALARHTLAAYPPDLLIEIPRTVCRSLDFHRAAEVIAVGRQVTATALDGLERERHPRP